MAYCSQFLRCRVIALPLLQLQPLLLLLLQQLPLCALREVTCPTPRSVEHADIHVKSHSVESRERYVCNAGFKRQAGTSSLIRCMLDQNSNTAHWTETNLKCIRDPTLVHQKLPSSTMSTRELFTPTGKGFTLEPEASKADTTVATETVMVSTSISLSSSIHTATPAIAEAQHYVTPISVAFISLLVVPLVVYLCCKKRNPLPEQSVEMEEMPMTGGTDSREEGVES
ncbi:interleukin-15 receptor subunit alpha isoform X4 [Dromiciops gliroides]|uniref:interleukin-15 receptor subunit alpha isoform X4 n=1 Tax=Dromiciops gliroides TaxID=33562 RepID=UPI001CC3A1BC|nr:interleukin-15 receptor subunit alpha isoform X4 [Dromiciops gliroides]